MDAGLLARVEAVLDERVRPALAAHGGGITVADIIAERTLVVRLLGDCAGCPAVDLSLERLVRREVLATLPAIRDVALAGGVSEDLLAQARRLLRRPADGPAPLRTCY